MPNATEELTDLIMAQCVPSPGPTYDQVRQKLTELADERGDWSGIPMLIEDLDLVVEPKYPYQMKKRKAKDAAPTELYTVINRWWNERYRCYIAILEDKKCRRFCIKELWNAGTMLLNTLGAMPAWDLEIELKAMQKLQSLVKPHIFKMYLMTGSFLETSKRSRVTYLFRRLRPTLAMSPGLNGNMRVLAGLCLHSIGYYRETWAGALTPTDEVISHLLWMRGDEHGFWKQANQHCAVNPASGL